MTSSSSGTIVGRSLVAGASTGRTLTTDQGLSFWGGLDPNTGQIIDRHHPLVGQSLTGCILVLPAGRGSCSASGVLLESIQNRTGPAGIVVSQVDPIIGLGAILGEELCGIVVPVLLVSEDDRAQIPAGVDATITASGSIFWTG